jgi:hypothetical protein
MATQSLPQTCELSSQVLANMNPLEVITKYNPAKQSTAVLVEINGMLGTSFKDFFAKAAPWILELKNNRFKVRPGSKGAQIEINCIPTYWHEFFDQTLSITRRHFQQLEKQVAEGTWREPVIREGDRVLVEVGGKDKEGRVVKIHETAEKVDVQPLAGENESLGATYEVITLPAEDVEKITPAKVTQVTTGQILLLMDMDGGSKYQYVGGGKIKRTGKPTVNAQRKAAEEAAEKEREAKAKAKREAAEKSEQAKKVELQRRAMDALKEEEALLEEKRRTLKKGAIPADLIATKGQGVRKTEKSAHGYYAYFDKRKAAKGHAPWCVVNEKDEKKILETCYTEQDALNSVKQRDDGMVVKEAVAKAASAA